MFAFISSRSSFHSQWATVHTSLSGVQAYSSCVDKGCFSPYQNNRSFVQTRILLFFYLYLTASLYSFDNLRVRLHACARKMFLCNVFKLYVAKWNVGNVSPRRVRLLFGPPIVQFFWSLWCWPSFTSFLCVSEEVPWIFFPCTSHVVSVWNDCDKIANLVVFYGLKFTCVLYSHFFALVSKVHSENCRNKSAYIQNDFEQGVSSIAGEEGHGGWDFGVTLVVSFLRSRSKFLQRMNL